MSSSNFDQNANESDWGYVQLSLFSRRAALCCRACASIFIGGLLEIFWWLSTPFETRGFCFFTPSKYVEALSIHFENHYQSYILCKISWKCCKVYLMKPINSIWICWYKNFNQNLGVKPNKGRNNLFQMFDF